jgi:hypothetical protein
MTRWLLSLRQKYTWIPDSIPRTIPYIVTMLVCGLWHGTSLTFIIWGLLHGLFLAVENMTQWIRRLNQSPGYIKWLNRLVVFGCVCLLWIFFQAANVPTALLYLRGLASLHSLPSIHLIKGICLLIGVTLIDLPDYLANKEIVFIRWQVLPRALVFGSLCLLIVVASHPGIVTFVYRGF